MNWVYGRKAFRAAGWLVSLALLVAALAWLTGSDAREPVADAGAALPVEQLRVVTRAGAFDFTVEVADDDKERARGLMFRESMAPTHGMLFDFGAVEPVNMWMRNTLISLDMVFIRPDGSVARIARDTKPGSLAIIASGEPVSHVLELNAGMARMINLQPGDRIIHPDFP